MSSNEIVNAIKPEALEVIGSITEISIDTILQEGLLRDIPIIGTLSSIYKMGANIQNAIFIRNIATFLYELKKHKFSEKSDELLSNLEKDESYRNKVSDTILILNAKFNNQRKAKIHACILLALAENRIEYKEFDLVSNIIDDINENDISIITDIERSEPKPYEDIKKSNIYDIETQMAGLEKLVWLGILKHDRLTYESIDEVIKRKYELTRIGNILYHFGIKIT